jgi:hypothetical protein
VNEFAGNVERHRRELLLHCYRMLGSLPDAEDAVQETLLRAWRYRDSVKERAVTPMALPRGHERTPASKVRLWCGSQHGPKHFNEGTYAVVTDCDSDLRDRFALCQHLKGSKQPRLLSPTAKGHACLSRKRTHESTAGHSGNMRPVVQRAFIPNIIHKSICNSG